MRRDSGRLRRGAALLEVIVALTILAAAGGSAATLAAQAAESVRRARQTDAEVRRAGAFLEVVALWPREDLDRRLGDHRQGAWRLRLSRPTLTLYLVALADSTGRTELLRTSLYRPEPRDATP